MNDLSKLECEFEWRTLEAKVTRRTRQDKSKINVDNMALSVQKDVAIMPENKTKTV